jgi:cell division protein FtsW
MIYEASSISAIRIYGDAFYFVKAQLRWFGVAMIAFVFFSMLDYHLLYSLALPILLGNLFLLMIVFVPGLYTTALGAKRWLHIGFINIQPSELTKMSLIIYLSAWFSFKERSRFVAFLFLASVVIGLVMIQPDLGTAVILGIMAVFLYFVSGAPLYHLGFIIPVAFVVVGFLAISSPYRFQRLVTFANPDSDPQGIGYHVKQINIALSLGGVGGVGFGNSRQKFQFLPEAHTDSIFAIIGENFGFIGTSLIAVSYMSLLYLAYKRFGEIRDRLGYLLASGIIFLIGLQTLINLGAMVQLLPLTGVPLPFISYGGSSLVTFYILLGILVNILNQQQKRA